MNTRFTLEELSAWIRSLIDAAKNDDAALVYWFGPTKNCPISIVGGWQQGEHTEENRDLFCVSPSNPSYSMRVKIVTNEGPYAYTDFDMLNMPVDSNGEVEDTCVILEWYDYNHTDNIASFFKSEWERLAETFC